MFLFDLAMKLLKNINVNKYAIDPKKVKEPRYRLIYNLNLIELGILKTQTKTNLKIGFI